MGQSQPHLQTQAGHQSHLQSWHHQGKHLLPPDEPQHGICLVHLSLLSCASTWHQPTGTLQHPITSTALLPDFTYAHDHVRLRGRQTLCMRSRPSMRRSPHSPSVHQTSQSRQWQHQHSLTCLPLTFPTTIGHCNTRGLLPRLPTFLHECRQNLQ